MASGKNQSPSSDSNLAAYGKCISFTRKKEKYPHDHNLHAPSSHQPLVSYSHAKWTSKMLLPGKTDLTRHPAAFYTCFLVLLAALYPREKSIAHGIIFSHRQDHFLRATGLRGSCPKKLVAPNGQPPTCSWPASPLTCPDICCAYEVLACGTFT